MKPVPRTSSHGLTMVEILIVVAIIAILASIPLMVNFNNSFKKARDSKRKQDLNKVTRFLEDYYNDHQKYPATDNPDNGNFNGAPWGSAFSPYVQQLPNDPSYPTYKYYYETDPWKQNFYALYARLEILSDPDIATVGCIDGCGPNRAFNYVVHSQNILVQDNPTGNELGAFPTQNNQPNPTTPAIPCSLGTYGLCLDCGGGRDCSPGTHCAYYATYPTPWICEGN